MRTCRGRNRLETDMDVPLHRQDTGTPASPVEPQLLITQQELMERVRPYMPLLRRFALRLTRNHHDGEDLLQDVLIRLIEHRGRVGRVSQLQPWLMRVMYYRFIDHCRRACPLNGAVSLDDVQSAEGGIAFAAEIHEAEVQDIPERLVQRLQESAAVTSAIGRLPRQQRAMVNLHDIQGLSLPEIAQRMGISVNTVKSGLMRARGSLRASLFTVSDTIVRNAGRMRRDAAAGDAPAAQMRSTAS